MPAKSKAQFRFMQMVAHSKSKMKNSPEGLSAKAAQEFVNATGSYKNLPERKKRAKKDALKSLRSK